MTVSLTLAQLQTDLETWIDNQSAEFTASVQTMITMAFQTMSKDLRIKALNVYDTTKTLTANNPLLLIPSVGTMLAMRGISVNTTGSIYKPLKPRLLSLIDVYWPDRTVTGTPKYYGEYDDTQWLISPTPVASSALRIAFRRQFALDFSTPSYTNWLITNHYDFVLTACMIEGARFVIDDRQTGLIAMNGARYTQLLDILNQTEKRTERDETRRPQKDGFNSPSATPDSEVE